MPIARAKEEHTKRRASGEFPPEIPKRWKWHYERLACLRDPLIEERSEALSEVAEPVERHSLHQADSFTVDGLREKLRSNRRIRQSPS